MAVPQDLDLEDVLVWGRSATDLLWLVAGIGLGWWLDLRVSDPLILKLAVGGPPALVGLAFGTIRIGERSLRAWVAIALRYARRPRVLVS